MSRRLSAEEKELICQLYAQCGVYADVARLVGHSPTTVAQCVKSRGVSVCPVSKCSRVPCHRQKNA